MHRVFPALAALAILTACSHRTAGPVTEPHVAPAAGEAMAPMEGMEPMGEMQGMGRMMRMHPLADPTDPVLLEGKRTFDQVCSACHTLEPPPRLAPPMRMISMHLRQSFENEKDGVGHILSYVPKPDAGKSILPDHAIERFGLMAPQALPRETLEKVARYVWSLGEGMEGMEGMEQGGMGMGRGRGMMGQGGGMQMRMRHRGGG